MIRTWSPKETALLERLFNDCYEISDIALELNRTPNSVSSKLYRLGYTRKKQGFSRVVKSKVVPDKKTFGILNTIRGWFR